MKLLHETFERLNLSDILMISGYEVVSGTSFAVPHITGLVGLIWGQSPSLNYKQVIQVILSGARPSKSLRGKSSNE